VEESRPYRLVSILYDGGSSLGMGEPVELR
jgi:hypothetical protein